MERRCQADPMFDRRPQFDVRMFACLTHAQERVSPIRPHKRASRRHGIEQVGSDVRNWPYHITLAVA
jgi:hypothetical protein